MSCDKTVLLLLVIVVSATCIPAEKESGSSSEETGPLMHQFSPNDYHRDRAGFFGFNNGGFPNFGQLFGFGGLNGSDPFSQLASAFGQFIPGLGGSNSSGFPNLFSAFMPHASGRSQQVDLPHDLRVGNETEDTSPPMRQFSPNDYHQDRAGFFDFNNGGFPNFGQLFGFGGLNGSDPFSQLASAFGQFIPGLGGSNSSGFPNLFSAFMPHASGRSQQVDLPHDLRVGNETEDPSPHERFFFSLFHHFFHNFFHNSHHNSNGNSNVFVGCNYTTQPGYSCSGCREQLICESSNVGRIRICPSNNPYCYNGVCGTFVNSTCTNSTG